MHYLLPARQAIGATYVDPYTFTTLESEYSSSHGRGIIDAINGVLRSDSSGQIPQVRFLRSDSAGQGVRVGGSAFIDECHRERVQSKSLCSQRLPSYPPSGSRRSGRILITC
jgi:hypothetical protein